MEVDRARILPRYYHGHHLSADCSALGLSRRDNDRGGSISHRAVSCPARACKPLRAAMAASCQDLMNIVSQPGVSAPLGATVTDCGVNFSVFSRNATGVELLLFENADDSRPSSVIRLDPTNRT